MGSRRPRGGRVVTATPYRLACPPTRPRAPELAPWRRAADSALNVYVAVLPPVAGALRPCDGWRPSHGEVAFILCAGLAWLARVVWSAWVPRALRGG